MVSVLMTPAKESSARTVKSVKTVPALAPVLVYSARQAKFASMENVPVTHVPTSSVLLVRSVSTEHVPKIFVKKNKVLVKTVVCVKLTSASMTHAAL
jgi:hypothetical protein